MMKNKYGNRKVVIDGIEFDSRKEANRYQELLLLQRAGQISCLARQVKYELIPKQESERACNYIADFVYVDSLGDVVTVRNRKMGFEKKAKVISYEYDALLKRYNKIELGDFLPSIYNPVTSGMNAQVTANAASTAVTQLATTVSLIQEQLAALDERVTALEGA